MTAEVRSPNASLPFRTPRTVEGPRRAILPSILGPVAWLSLTLLYVGFWAPGFTLFQSIVVILVSAIALVGVMGAAWSWYGFRRGPFPGPD